MAERIMSLGCDNASQVVFDEEIAEIFNNDEEFLDCFDQIDEEDYFDALETTWTASQGETLMQSEEDEFL